MKDVMINLEQCPSDWPRVELGRICNVVGGFAAPKGDEPFEEGTVPFVRMQDLGRYHRTTNLVDTKDRLNPDYVKKRRLRIIKKGSILIPRSGSVSLNHRAILGADACIVSHICALVLKSSDVDNRYLYYALCNFDMRNIMRKTTGLDAITFKEVMQVEIPLPPLNIQRGVACVLQRADFIRRKRKKANQLVNQIIRSVFQKMFGNKKLDSKIGDVACFVSSGATPLGGKKTYVKEGITFIRSQNVLMNELSLDNVAHISEKTHHSMRRTWVKNGDILLNITGASLGRVAVYRGADDEANVNQHVCIIRVDENKAVPEYVLFHLSSPNTQRQIWTIQAGASRQALNYRQVKSLDIYLPPIDDQLKFLTIAKHITNLRDSQTQSTKQINEFFHALMYKVFRGKLNVKTLERRVLEEHKSKGKGSLTLEDFIDRPKTEKP